MDDTLVGRRDELSRLVAVARETTSVGGAAVAVVTGEPGSGKSRLLEEAAHVVVGRHQLTVRGHEVEHRVPLAAAGGLLRTLADEPAAGQALRGLLFPGADAPGSGSELTPMRVFEASHQVLRRLQPALLVIDDLQWVDEQSRALCHYLVRAAAGAGQRLAVWVATRPRESAVFVRSLTELVTADQVTSVELGPLERDEGLALIRLVAPDMSSERAVELWERAQGSPFWLRALAGADDPDGAGEAVLQAQLRGAGQAAVEPLAALAVTGRPTPIDELARLLDTSPESLHPIVVRLMRRGLLVDRAGHLELAHELIRAAVLQAAPERFRRQLHGRLARWIDTLGTDDPKLLLAALRHRKAAGLPVADVGLRLARVPQRHLIGRDAFAQLAEVADAEDPAEPQAVELQTAVARLASARGDYRSSFLRWTALAERLEGPDARAWAALSAAKAAYELRIADEALAYLHRARHLAHDDPVLGVFADAQASAIRRWLQHRREDARELAVRATDAARRMAAEGRNQDPRARRAHLAALTAAFDAATVDADSDQMLAIADEMVRVAHAFDERARLRGLFSGALALRFLGRPREAELRLRMVVDQARHRIVPKVLLTATYWLARVLHEQGRLDEATRTAADVAQLADRIDSLSPTGPRIGRLRAWLELSTGDWQGALAELEAVAEEESDPHFRLDAHDILATWIARLEASTRAGDVVARVHAAVADADVSGCRRCQADVRLRGAVALARVGAVPEGEALLASGDEHRYHPPGPAAVWGRAAEGMLLASHDPPAGTTQLLQAADMAETMGLHLEALWARLDAGRLLAPMDTDRAVRLLEQAAHRARSLGAVTEARVAQEGLRALGVRAWTRGPSAPTTGNPWQRLTLREQDIARRVVAGATNPTIAAELFLSRRTVERHISNILNKLGVRNRTELAGLLAEFTEVGGPHS